MSKARAVFKGNELQSYSGGCSSYERVYTRGDDIQSNPPQVDKLIDITELQNQLAEKDAVIAELKSMYEGLENAKSEGNYYGRSNTIINYIGNLK